MGQSNRDCTSNRYFIFFLLGLNYAYSQLKITPETARQCNFNILGGKATGTYRFLTEFYCLVDMLAEFQRAMDRTLNNSKNTFCFLDDILIVSKGSEAKHEKLITDVLIKLNRETSNPLNYQNVSSS